MFNIQIIIYKSFFVGRRGFGKEGEGPVIRKKVIFAKDIVVVMKHLYAILIALALGCSAAPQAFAQDWTSQSAWALSDDDRTDGSSRAPEIEVSSKEGNIYIRTPRRVKVTVYTILGQIVTERTINPGISELKIGTRGIYLVKIEGKTQKVAL